MRLHLILFLLFSQFLYSETLFHKSNKSGMLLGQIKDEKLVDIYVKEEIDNENFTKSFTLFNNNIIQHIKLDVYTENFKTLVSSSKIEKEIKTVEFYTDELLRIIETYKNKILYSSEKYSYNSDRKLHKVELIDLDGVLIYTDVYFRNKDGALRAIKRSSEIGYYYHWFYKDGAIIESWFIEGNSATQTKYNNSGAIFNVTDYVNDVLVSNEEIEYFQSGKLKSSNKSIGTNIERKKFNNRGVISESNTYENNILQKKELYEYKDDVLVKVLIVGHGKKEETFYYRNKDNIINLIEYYVNDKLKRKEYIIDEDTEIWEHYRDEILYLKEYYYLGERLKKELYHKGSLFKSEIFSE
ncbi:MAG: hypothetical protein OCD02_22375 [Spirochaetaceae bacterium]